MLIEASYKSTKTTKNFVNFVSSWFFTIQALNL